IEKNFFDVDSSQLSSTFHNIGYSYDGLEMYDMAIEYYEKALIHRGSLNDISTASTHECLALALQGKGSYKEAMEYFQKLEIFFEKTDEINEIIYLEIAELCDLMDNKEKAKEYREKAQRIIDSISEED
ncbi:MAG: tetratricopeptide repeat protein, partial [Oscillospiraceae bacterium]|nr:tetratricopeptide repeat protein [Oscillospiraceae bacterium]